MSSSQQYITGITLQIKFNSIPSERITFNPQVNCRTHYNIASTTPIVLDPATDEQWIIKYTTIEIPNNDIGPNDICIVYLNYKGIIRTFPIYNPRGDNSYFIEVD